MSATLGDGPFAAFAGDLAVLMSQALRVFAFEYRGETVPVDGMRWRPHGPTAPAPRSPGIHYEPPSAYLHSEPRIRLFVDLFTRMLQHFSFTVRGDPVEVDAVRLAHLKRWSRYRLASLFDNLSPITSACSARCVFCYREGTLQGTLLGLAPRMLSVAEARTRAKYWRRDKKAGLPHRQADAGDPFANRHVFSILDVARSADPDGVITLLTNGDYLDPGCIGRLSTYKPLLMVLSVNTVDLAKRRELMRPRNAQNGARAAELLREAGIPYIGSIVAEQRLGLADIERTMRHLDRCGSLAVRILLPGYTRHSLGRALPGLDEWWRQVADLVLSVRETIGCPVLASPALYWDTDVVPRIEGLHRESTARKAGLRIGDVVRTVNRARVFTKADALRLLQRCYEKGQPCRLRVERDGGESTVTLEAPRPGNGSQSKDLEWRPAEERYGIFMNRGLDLASLAWIRARLGRFRNRKRVLLFSSPLTQPHLLALARYLKDFDRGHDVRTTVADHEFWGGNIRVADLHVVGDYVAKIRRLARKGWAPDVVFIPDSFLTGKWGFDVAGNSYRRIEAETGVRTILVPVTRIME